MIYITYSEKEDVIIYENGDDCYRIKREQIISDIRKYLKLNLNINIVYKSSSIAIECEYDSAHYRTTFYIAEYIHDKDGYLKWLAREIAIVMGMELFFKEEG